MARARRAAQAPPLSTDPSPLRGEGLKTLWLPYQQAWLNDTSRLKIAEKSRRIGWTYVQSYEDARDAARQGGMDVWFSSADESAAREYILYVQQWAELFHLAAEVLGEVVLSAKDDIKALSVRFASGKRINALSSNPKAFRSKGGKLVLDEYAFHPDPDALWRAASPIITWGYPARVISTHNGQAGRYFRMVDEARHAGPGGNRWSLHSVTIEQALAQGLLDKILGRPATEADRAGFLADCRATAGDEETYLQEYLCQPIDATTAWLTWDLITGCEHVGAGVPALYQGGPCYVGMDIARRRDLTVIEVDELVGDVLWTREVIRLQRESFAAQMAALDGVMARYDVKRACIDQTGIGEAPTEQAQARHGKGRIEGVLFTGQVKQDLAVRMRQRYEDARLRTPPERAYRDAHHAVRKLVTAAGNARFDADRSEAGHADEFWAHALAVHALDGAAQGPAYRWMTVPGL
jgi:phage FluMu gp28-like protein